MLDTDGLSQLLQRLSSADYDWGVTFFELLLIGASVNWCAGVLQGTRGTRPLRGMLIVLVVATLLVRVLAARMDWVRLELLYRYFVIGLAFVALVAFQPELRRAFIRAGDVRFRRRGTRQSRTVAALVKAARYLSRNRYGALIAIERSVDLRGWAENGTPIGADVSADLLNTIFFPNSPLHDLGVIIRGGRIVAANCQFPQAESDEVEAALGSRHLAAVGMSYESDALVLVISEETGTISLADNGKLRRFLSLEDLAGELATRLTGQSPPPSARAASRSRLSRVWRIVRRVLVVVPLTLVIWYLADQATQRSGTIEVQLAIQRQNPALWIDQLSPPAVKRAADAPVTRFTVSFSGSTRTIERLRAEASAQPLELEWSLPQAYARPGRHTVPAKDVMAAIGAIRARGLIVENVSPDSLVFSVDQLATVPLPLVADTGRIKVSDLRFDPPEVSVTLPRRQLAGIRQADRHAVVRLGQRLEHARPGELLRFESLPVQQRIAGLRPVALEPQQVNLALRVVGQVVRRRLSNIVVSLLCSPQVLEQYRLEQRDPNEWLIELEVEGDKDLVEALRPQDVRAFAQISSDILSPAPGFRSVEVTVLLPEGVTMVGPRRVVQLRAVARPAGTP